MRIRRSVTRFFGISVLPAIWGERGLLVLSDVQARLGVETKELADAQGARSRLEHRIALMRAGDPDVVEELARRQLMIGGPGQVSVPRAGH